MYVIEFAFGIGGEGRGKDKKKRKKRVAKIFKKVLRAEGRAVKKASSGLNVFQTTKAGLSGVRSGTKLGIKSARAAKKLGAGEKGQERALIAGANVGARYGVAKSLARQQASRLKVDKKKRAW